MVQPARLGRPRRVPLRPGSRVRRPRARQGRERFAVRLRTSHRQSHIGAGAAVRQRARSSHHASKETEVDAQQSHRGPPPVRPDDGHRRDRRRPAADRDAGDPLCRCSDGFEGARRTAGAVPAQAAAVALAAQPAKPATLHQHSNLSMDDGMVTINGQTKKWQDLTPAEKAEVRRSLAEAREELAQVTTRKSSGTSARR